LGLLGLFGGVLVVRLDKKHRNILLLAGCCAVAGYLVSRKDKDETRKEQLLTRGEQENEDLDHGDEFDRARSFATKGLGNVETNKQLELYSLFKQATIGDCNIAKPSILDFVANSKYSAWKKLEGMSMTKAKENYVRVISDLSPGWDSLSVEEKLKLEKSSGGGGGIGPTVSTFALGEDKPENEQTDVEFLFTLACRGSTAELIQRLSVSSTKVSELKGEDQETLLHMVCDRGHLETLHALIELGCDMEACDVDGLTPLAYALMNEHEHIALELVRTYKANLHAKDSSGAPILELCSDEIARTLRELH